MQEEKALAINQLHDAKVRLAAKFEHDIMEMAASIEEVEEKAWKLLNSRYTKGDGDRDSNPTGGVMDAAERAARGRLASLLQEMTLQQSQLQDASFYHASLFEFEYALFEIFTSSRLDAYYTKTLSRLQAKWEIDKSQMLAALQVDQAKSRAHRMTPGTSPSQQEEISRQQDEEDHKLETKLTLSLRKNEMQFDEAKCGSMKVYASKLDAIRSDHEQAIISAAGLEKLKAICQIYQRLRPK